MKLPPTERGLRVAFPVAVGATGPSRSSMMPIMAEFDAKRKKNFFSIRLPQGIVKQRTKYSLTFIDRFMYRVDKRFGWFGPAGCGKSWIETF
jgi:hypothetical protein